MEAILKNLRGLGNRICLSWMIWGLNPLIDPTIADAICDRIIHNSHRIELKGESVRKIYANFPELLATFTGIYNYLIFRV